MDKKKTASAAALAAAAAAGMVTGALFDTPADLLGEPDAVVETQADDDDTGALDDEERQKTPAQRLRQWILALPAAVRMLVGVPLWCLGWVLLVRLYPEQGGEFRIPQLRGGGKLYLCCSRDGLFEVKM